MKKTNIRIRRNGGSKTASPQVPNKPDSARARTRKTSKRFEGVVKSFNAELGFGFITIASELATKLKLKPEQDLYFHMDAVPENKAHLLHAGAKVSFAVEQGDKGPRAAAIQTHTLAAELPASAQADKPWWHSNELQCLIFGKEEQTQDCIWASCDGKLYLWNASLDREPREVTFDVARDWWEKFHDPKFEFAAPYFKEYTTAEQLASVVSKNWDNRNAEIERKLAPPNLETAICQSVALAYLMEARSTSSECLDLDEPFKGKFDAGLASLVHDTNEKLLNAFYDEQGGSRVVARSAAMKGGAK